MRRDLGVSSSSDEGGKAKSLRRLAEAGFAVPRFIVVGPRVLDGALGGRRSELDALFGHLEPGDPSGLEASAAWAAEVVAGSPWPSGFLSDLEMALAPLDRGQGFAVRSSAPEEDSAAHSFAGVFESMLAVRREDVPAAIRKVWTSAFSARVLAYRRRKGLGLTGITMAVVVQEMVPATVAGVLFTRDPDDADRLLVSAGLGLSEGVVSGSIETDIYRIARGGRRIEREGGGGTALRDHQVRRLCEVGLEAEALLGRPLDVEWAFDERGRLFVLQARPIVGRAAPARRVWDSANVVESYPGLTLPLTFSFARRAYAGTFRRAARGLLPFDDPFRDEPEVFSHLIGLLDGRIYYNLLHWYALFKALPGSDRYRETWDRMLGIRTQTTGPEPEVGLLARAGTLVSVLVILARPRSLGAKFARLFEAFHGRHRNIAATPGAHALITGYRRLEREALSFWHLTLYNDFCALKHLQWLNALAHRYGFEDAVPALLGGHDDLESVAPLRSLAALAARVREDVAGPRLFASRDDAGVWAALRSEPAHEHLRLAFDRHLETYGDRGIEELKLETPTYREEPLRLVGLLRSWLESEAPRGRGAADARREAEALVDARLRDPLRRGLIRILAARARLCLGQRESMRLARTRLFGLVRRTVRRLGEDLAAEGRLEAAADIFYLSLDELEDILEGASVTSDLGGLARLRHADYARFARHEPPARLETHGIPVVSAGAAALETASGAGELRGIPSAPGRVAGRAVVVGDPRESNVVPGRILVTRTTDPGWIFLMAAASGLVAERGSPLSHTAIIGRELGIPTVVGVEGATRRIPDGALIVVDGGTGVVRVLAGGEVRCA